MGNEDQNLVLTVQTQYDSSGIDEAKNSVMSWNESLADLAASMAGTGAESANLEEQLTSDTGAETEALTSFSASSQQGGTSFLSMTAAVAAGQAIFEASKAAIEAVTGALRDQVAEGMSTVDSVARSANALASVTGNAKTAHDTIAELTRFSEVSPFDVQTLTSAAQRLAAMGVATDQLVPSIKAMADIAEVSGGNLSQMATSLGMVSGDSQLAQGAIRQLSMQGVDLVGMLQKAAGAGLIHLQTMQKVDETTTKLKYDTATVNEELALNAQRTKEASANHKTAASTLMALKDEHEKLTAQLTETTSNTKKVNEAMAITNPTAKDITNALKAGTISYNDIAAAMEFATSKGGSFSGAVAADNDLVSSRTKMVADRFQVMRDTVLGLSADGTIVKGGFYDKLSQAAIQLTDWIGKNTDSINKVAKTITGELVDAFNEAKKIFDDVVGGLQNLKKWWDGNSDSVYTVKAGINILKEDFENIWEVISKRLVPDLEKLWEKLKPLAEILGAALFGAIQIALLGFHDLLDAFDWAIQKLSTFFNWLNKVTDKLENSKIGQFISSASNGLLNLMHEAHIPGFASGTDFAPGGMALVGENGPEVVNLPRGSQVIPNDKLSNSGGGDVHIHIEGTLMINDAEMIGQLADTIAQRIGMRARQTLNGSY